MPCIAGCLSQPVSARYIGISGTRTFGPHVEILERRYPNAILVPLADDAALVIPDLALPIEPSPENGCSKPCWAVSNLVATTSKARLTATPSLIMADQLAAIRRQIALAVGIET